VPSVKSKGRKSPKNRNRSQKSGEVMKLVLVVLVCVGFGTSSVAENLVFKCEAPVAGHADPGFHWPIRYPVIGPFGISQDEFDKVLGKFRQCHERCDGIAKKAKEAAEEKVSKCTDDVGERHEHYCRELAQCGLGKDSCELHECGAKCNIAYHRTLNRFFPPPIFPFAAGPTPGAQLQVAPPPRPSR
jgi:hypothetical protein